jgi:hypothetical protein
MHAQLTPAAAPSRPSTSRAAAGSRVLPLVLFAAIAFLLITVDLARLFAAGQPVIKQDVLLKFADFDYARTLDRADVVALLGPPTSIEPLQPGMAEVCSWEATYPTLLGSDAFRLNLCFNRTEPRSVVAGGLYRNEKAVKP